MNVPVQRVEICIKTRKFAAACVGRILPEIKSCSESETRDLLASELSKDKELYEGGWYDPPPKGIAVLFGSPPSYRRSWFDSLRKPELWPSGTVRYSEDVVASIYASPVHKASGSIGDFGGSFYRGPDPKIRSHLTKAFQVTEKIAEYAAPGMKFSELFSRSEVLLAAEGLANHNVAYVNSQGANIGHTVPWSYGDISEKDKSVIRGEDLAEVIKLLGSGRTFINAGSDFVIPRTVALTLEPTIIDPENPDLPLAFYHFVVSFIEGEKVISANFLPAFEAWGMEKYITSTYG